MQAITQDQQVEEYQRDGVLVLRGLFCRLGRAVEGAGSTPTCAEPELARTHLSGQMTAPLPFFQDLCSWQRISAVSRLRSCTRPRPRSRLPLSWGPVSARIFHDHVLVKEPGTSVVTPWHQDQPYYFVDGRQSVSFWLPLDPVARDISIEYVVGSHRWGKDFKPKRFDGHGPLSRR